jgi:thioredoxin-dependent peroxiredoxin
VILGCSFDTEAENAAFAKKFSYNFPLLCDTDRKVGMAFGAADNAKSGSAKRIAVIIGPDGKVKQFFPKVSAGSFPKEALELL